MVPGPPQVVAGRPAVAGPGRLGQEVAKVGRHMGVLLLGGGHRHSLLAGLDRPSITFYKLHCQVCCSKGNPICMGDGSVVAGDPA